MNRDKNSPPRSAPELEGTIGYLSGSMRGRTLVRKRHKGTLILIRNDVAKVSIIIWDEMGGCVQLTIITQKNIKYKPCLF